MIDFSPQPRTLPKENQVDGFYRQITFVKEKKKIEQWLMSLKTKNKGMSPGGRKWLPAFWVTWLAKDSLHFL